MTSATAKWLDMPALSFDTETSGTDVYSDRIVTAGLVEINPGRRPTLTEYVVDPGIDIPAEAAAVHGYTRARAQAEATHTVEQMLTDVAARIAHWLGRNAAPLVVFNAPFDLTLFEVECRRHGIPGLRERLAGRVLPVIDPKVLVKAAEPFRKRECACGCGVTDFTLGSWCRHYKVIATGAHGACGDALATGRLWPKVLHENRGHGKRKPHQTFVGLTLPTLHSGQMMWAKEHATSFQAWVDKQEPEKAAQYSDIDAGWPFHSQMDARLRDVEAVA